MDDARRRGAVYTPHPLARRLAVAVLDGAPPPRTACDLAAGDGRLLAALRAEGAADVAVYAADVDGSAWQTGPLAADPTATFVAADALGRGLDLWPTAPDAGVDVVVGNPPFLSQLSRLTARSAEQRHRTDVLGAISGMADSSTAFLLAACEVVRPGGRVGMIMPLSFLTADDAAPVRRAVLATCDLLGIWVSAGPAFPDAAVETCALVLERRPHGQAATSSILRRWSGPEWHRTPDRRVAPGNLVAAATWGPLVVDLITALPDAEVATHHGRLGDIARATAGFRDEFYGLVPLVREVGGTAAGRTDAMAPLITSGAIDPGRLLWGERPSRISRRDLLRPAIAPAEIDEGSRLARWVVARRVPKVLVATQTATIEAVADPTGEWVPSTPVVSVECEPERLWHVLAALMSPAATLWARQHFTGAALSTRALKLSARHALDLPLPPAGRDWDAAAELWAAGHDVASGGAPAEVVRRAGALTARAHGMSEEVVAWWQAEVDRRLARRAGPADLP